MDWFSVVYHRGYVHGFFRAIAYFQHHAKEGRLRRLRDLWNEGVMVSDRRPGKHDLRGMMMSDEAYTEFEQLLNLSFGVKLDAKGSQNVSAAGQDGDAHVPGQEGKEGVPSR